MTENTSIVTERDKQFGRDLQNERVKKGYTVRQVATYSGVSSTYISRIENGHRRIPKNATLLKLAKGVRMSPTEMMKMAGVTDFIDADEFNETQSSLYKSSLDVEIGERIHDLRAKNNETETELASAIGKTRAIIESYEAGEVEIGIKTIIRIANHYRVSTDYLLTGNKATITNISDAQIKQEQEELLDQGVHLAAASKTDGGMGIDETDKAIQDAITNYLKSPAGLEQIKKRLQGQFDQQTPDED